MTLLLKGQAVKLAFGSTSVTCSFGSSRFKVRAQLAPAKPPPITTTRGAAWENAGVARKAAETVPRLPARNWRRVARSFGITSSLIRLTLCLQPGGDRLCLFGGKPLGDAVHHGRRARAGAELRHRSDNLRGIAAVQR